MVSLIRLRILLEKFLFSKFYSNVCRKATYYYLPLNIRLIWKWERKNWTTTMTNYNLNKRIYEANFFSQLQHFNWKILSTSSLFSRGKKNEQPLPFPILPKWYLGMDSHQYGILIFHRKYNNALRIFNSHKFPLFQNFANFLLFGKGWKTTSLVVFLMNFKQSIWIFRLFLFVEDW